MRRSIKILLTAAAVLAFAVILYWESPQSPLLQFDEVKKMRAEYGQDLLLPTELPQQMYVRSAEVRKSDRETTAIITVDLKWTHHIGMMSIYESSTEQDSMPSSDGMSHDEIGRNILGHIPIHGYSNTVFSEVRVGEDIGYYYYENPEPGKSITNQRLVFIRDGVYVSMFIGLPPDVFSKEQVIELADSSKLYQAN